MVRTLNMRSTLLNFKVLLMIGTMVYTDFYNLFPLPIEILCLSICNFPVLSFTSPLKTAISLLDLWIWLFNYFMLVVSCSIWPRLVYFIHVTLSSFIHVFACCRTSLLSKSESYPVMCIVYVTKVYTTFSLSIHPLMDI